MTWLPGFERIDATRTGGSYTGGPWKLVLHTTEGWSVASAVAAYRSHGGWPHFTVSYPERRKVQHISLDVASRALRNQSGGVQTNRDSAIQVEIVGFAAHAHEMTGAPAAWLRDEVITPIRAAKGIPPVTPAFVSDGAYGVNAPQRFSLARWDAFHGVCGHQHVPENSHWDPGRIPIAELLGDDDMPLNDADKKWIIDTVSKIAHEKVYERTVFALRQATGKDDGSEPASRWFDGVRKMLSELKATGATGGLSDADIDRIVDRLKERL